METRNQNSEKKPNKAHPRRDRLRQEAWSVHHYRRVIEFQIIVSLFGNVLRACVCALHMNGSTFVLKRKNVMGNFTLMAE